MKLYNAQIALFAMSTRSQNAFDVMLVSTNILLLRTVTKILPAVSYKNQEVGEERACVVRLARAF